MKKKSHKNFNQILINGRDYGLIRIFIIIIQRLDSLMVNKQTGIQERTGERIANYDKF